MSVKMYVGADCGKIAINCYVGANFCVIMSIGALENAVLGKQLTRTKNKMIEWKRPQSVPVPSVWAEFQGKREYNGEQRKYWIQDITDYYLDDIVNHMTKLFTHEEALCKYSGIWNDVEALEEFAGVWRVLLSQNIGLICLTRNEEGIAEIAGINCTYMALKNEALDNLQTEKASRVYEACKYISSAIDIFESFGVDHYVTAMGLFVPSRFRGEGIGGELLKAREPLCRAIGVKVTATIFTSTTSQILAERVGYKDLFTLSYDDFLKANDNFIFPGIQQAAKDIRFMFLLYE